MAIEYFDDSQNAICDYCKDRLPGEPTYQDAITAMTKAGWEIIWDGKDYMDYCPECLKVMKTRKQ